MERCEFGVCGVKSKEKGQITMETAFESAPIEVLVCLKELHQENNHLKSLLRIQSRKDVRTLLSLTGNEEDSELHLHCKKEDSSINLEKLLDLCSSQATEIAKLKRDVDLLERRNSNLQNELEAKELEIDRMRLEMNKDAQKKIEAATNADRSTQTNEDQSKVTQYLPVPEQPSADLSGLQQNPEPSLFNHIFTPRSRLLPTQNLTFDSTPIRHDNPKHAKVHLHAPKFLTLITDNCWSLSLRVDSSVDGGLVSDPSFPANDIAGLGISAEDLRTTLLRCEAALVRTRARLATEHQASSPVSDFSTHCKPILNLYNIYPRLSWKSRAWRQCCRRCLCWIFHRRRHRCRAAGRRRRRLRASAPNWARPAALQAPRRRRGAEAGAREPVNASVRWAGPLCGPGRLGLNPWSTCLFLTGDSSHASGGGGGGMTPSVLLHVCC
jgi:hypothetical protein